jgi:hypothetical protein
MAQRIPAHLNHMLSIGFFPSLHFHHIWQWPHQEMISSVLIVLFQEKKNMILNLRLAEVQKSSPAKIRRFNNASMVTVEIAKPANWIRSANVIGPPLELESISFLASVSRSNAAESPLFSGLLISGLYLKN